MSGGRAVVGTMIGAGGARLRTLRWEVPDPVGRIVVTHGLGEHAGRYAGLAEALGRRGYGLFAFDLRGHGGSEGRRGHVADFGLFLEDLHLARAEAELRLPGPGAPFLIGHSLGGLILLRYLQTYRPTTPGAVLSAPWLGTAREVPAWKRALARILTRVAPDLAIPEPIPSEDLTRDPEEARAWEEDPLVHPRITAGLWNAVQEAQERALGQGVEPTIPALVLLPGDDRVADAARTLAWARGLEGSRVEWRELPEGRHEPFHDLGRDEVFDLVAGWIDARREAVAGGEPEDGGRVSSPPDDTP